MHTIREAAEATGYAEATWRKWISKGRVEPSEKDEDGRWLIDDETVREIQKMKMRGDIAVPGARNKAAENPLSKYIDLTPLEERGLKRVMSDLEQLTGQEVTQRHMAEVLDRSERQMSKYMTGNQRFPEELSAYLRLLIAHIRTQREQAMRHAPENSSTDSNP